jgi:hypothetical protein
MSYEVNKTDTTPLGSVPDREADTTLTSISLLGKNYAGYGEIMAENLVHMLENFSSPIAPDNPIVGQLWWNDDTETLKIYSKTGWVPVNPPLVKNRTITANDSPITELDHGKYIRVNNTSEVTPITVKLPNTPLIPVGTSILIGRVGPGDVIIAGDGDSIVDPRNVVKAIASQFGRVNAIKVDHRNNKAYWEIDTNGLVLEEWTVTPNITTVTEGGTVIFTVTARNLVTGSPIPDGTYYWSIEQTGGISGADFTNTSMSGTFTLANGTGNITKTLVNDALVEGLETIVLSVQNAKGTELASVTVNVRDSNQTSQPTCAFTSIPSSINESDTGTFNVTTTNVTNGTTLYWNIQTNASDFSISSGSFTITNNSGSFTVNPTADLTTEGAETFTVSVHIGSITGTTLVTSNPVTINDTSVSSAIELAQYFWNRRSNLVRYNQHQVYQGDDYIGNEPNFRYVPSFTNSWYYENNTNTLPLISNYFTVISAVTGNIRNYGGITSLTATPNGLLNDLGINTYIGDGVQSVAQPSLVGNGFGISMGVQVYQGQVNTLQSNSITATHSGANQGVWAYSYIIPGKWRFKSPVVNFDTSTYAPTLGPGEMHFILIERGGNYSSMMPKPIDLSTAMTVDNWWYNGGGVQLAVNTTSNPVTLSWPLITVPDLSRPIDNGEGGVSYPDINVSYFNGLTPRFGGILENFG